MSERELPNNWEAIQLEELIDFVIGGDWGKDQGKDLEDDYQEAICIRGSEIRNWNKEKGLTAAIRMIKQSSLEKRALAEGDILLEISGGGPDQPVGRTVIIDRDALSIQPNLPKVCSNFFRLLRLTPFVDKRYVNHYLQYFYKTGEIVNYQAGSNNLRNLKYKEYSTISIPLPPLAEQKRIVAKLDAAFAHLDKIKAKLERIPELLKNFRQAVLTQAVTGKLTEGWRSESLKDLRKSLKDYESIRENDYQSESLILKKEGRSVPKLPSYTAIKNVSISDTWFSITVESASTFIVDCLHSTPKFTSSGEYCIDTTCIAPSKIFWQKARKVTKGSFNERISRMAPKKGDVLFSREGTIGTAVYFDGQFPICLGQRMMMFRFSSFINPRFAEIYLLSSYFKNLYKPFIVGTSAQHLNIGSIRELEFLVPTLEEQNQIVKVVESLFAKADAIEAQYLSLKEKIVKLPQALLAKAFRGELVPQDEADEPASVLLENIKQAKQSLTKPTKETSVKAELKRKTIKRAIKEKAL